MPAPKIRLSEQHSIDDQRRHLSMGMAHQNHIHSRHLPRNRKGLVLMLDLSRINNATIEVFFETHMHRNHN